MITLPTTPIPGAARYFSAASIGGKFYVFMIDADSEGFEAVAIQTCKTLERATKAAERWQIKENKAVAKAAAKATRVTK